VADESTFPHS